MLRELDFNEISDGKFYQSQDMVRADCGGCKAALPAAGAWDPLSCWIPGCPPDCFRLVKSFDELLASHLELQVVDGIILPNLKMTGPGEACTFLNDQADAPSIP